MTKEQSGIYALQRNNAVRVTHIDKDDEDLAMQWGRFIPQSSRPISKDHTRKQNVAADSDEHLYLYHGGSSI